MVVRRLPMAERSLAHGLAGTPIAWSLVLLLGMLAGALLTGCGAREVEQPETVGRFKALAILRGRFVGTRQGRSPLSEKAFRQFVQKEGRGVLRRFGVEDPGDLFISPRDQQPLVLRFDAPSGSESDYPIAYERQGADGKRAVITALGSVELLNESELQERLK